VLICTEAGWRQFPINAPKSATVPIPTNKTDSSIAKPVHVVLDPYILKLREFLDNFDPSRDSHWNFTGGEYFKGIGRMALQYK
jgi:hypothetical protein